MKNINEYCKQTSLNEYLSSKVDAKKCYEFPGKFSLPSIEAYLDNNGFEKQEINNTYITGHNALQSVANYIKNNTPYSGVDNKLDTMLYVKEYEQHRFYAFVLTFEEYKGKLVCHFIEYNEPSFEISISSYNSIIAFDSRKMYRSYHLSNNIGVYQNNVYDYKDFKEKIEQHI